MSVLMATAFCVPMRIKANASPRQINVQVYDRDHRDYHEWNSRETHSYEQYRKEHPKFNVNFSRTNRKQ